MEDHKFSRRKFIGRFLNGTTLAIGGALVLGSSIDAIAKAADAADPEQKHPKKKTTTKKTTAPKTAKTAKPAAKVDPCDDYTGVSETDLANRKRLAYVKQSPIPDSHCSNCALHIPQAPGKSCGGCMLFKGPVRPEGYCAYWAPINKS